MADESSLVGARVPGSLGAWTMTGDRIIVESLCKGGFDFIGIDLQHGFFGIESCLGAIQIANLLSIPVYVRLSVRELPLVPRVLDHGAQGVLVAMIESINDVQASIEASRYQPIGRRSYGGTRFGLEPEPLDPRQRRPEVFAMIETLPALESLRAISGCDGLSGLAVGPIDLALAASTPFPPHGDAQWEDTVESVAVAAVDAGVPSLTFALGGDDARRWLERGFTSAVVASDIALLKGAVQFELSKAGRTDQERQSGASYR